MLSHSPIPIKFWHHSFATLVHIINMLSNVGLVNFHSPFMPCITSYLDTFLFRYFAPIASHLQDHVININLYLRSKSVST